MQKSLIRRIPFLFQSTLSACLLWAGLLLATTAAHADGVVIGNAPSTNGSWSGSNPQVWTPSAASSRVAASDVVARLAVGPVKILSGTGRDLTVAAPLAWSANTLTLSADGAITVLEPMTASASAGLTFEYGLADAVAGNPHHYTVYAPVNLAATASFTTRRGSDGTSISHVIITTLGQPDDATSPPSPMSLQGMTASSDQHFVLGVDIDASPIAAWRPDGNGNYAGFLPRSELTGSFDGLGHTISGLHIYRNQYLCLINNVKGGTLQHLRMLDVDYVVTGMIAAGVAAQCTNGCLMRHVSSEGGRIAMPEDSDIGGGYIAGLVANLDASTIEDSYSTTTIAVHGPRVGGLAARAIEGAQIRRSWAGGNVTGRWRVGGLVGEMEHGTKLEQVCALGNVTGVTPSPTSANNLEAIGGLVGYAARNTIIREAFATGNVSGVAYVGGLIGWHGTNLVIEEIVYMT